MTIPSPNIIAIIEDPPYDIIGKGDPTIGSKPKTIIMFTATFTPAITALLTFTSSLILGNNHLSVC